MGTEAFWVPAVLAAAGSGAQYVNQQQANSRQNADETQSIIDQQNLQQKAVGGVNALTKQIGQNSPTATAAKATGDYVNQLRSNAGASKTNQTSALAPAIGADPRYSADTTASNNAVADYGNTKAGQMGQIDAAVRQRQNEGLSMQTLGTQLNGLGAQSYTKNFVDQLRASADGQQNPWVSLFGSMATNAGKNYTSAGPKTTPVITSQYSGNYAGPDVTSAAPDFIS